MHIFLPPPRCSCCSEIRERIFLMSLSIKYILIKLGPFSVVGIFSNAALQLLILVNGCGNYSPLSEEKIFSGFLLETSFCCILLNFRKRTSFFISWRVNLWYSQKKWSIIFRSSRLGIEIFLFLNYYEKQMAVFLIYLHQYSVYRCPLDTQYWHKGGWEGSEPWGTSPTVCLYHMSAFS